MPMYIARMVGGTFAVAICDRCGTKHPYAALRADGNSPGLRVCEKCWDEKDPYKLPARQTENISLRYPRPEKNLATDQ